MNTGARLLTLIVDGRPAAVEPGSSVAAALWNAGVHRFRTSASGEPRGPLCAMGICFECRVTIDGVPHRRACMIRCAPGMSVTTGGVAQGTALPGAAAAAVMEAKAATAAVASVAAGHPSEEAQRVAVAAPDAPAVPAGEADGGLQPVQLIEADVAVVGGGPAGIAAACLAAEAGARVVLLDEGAAPGGQIWRRGIDVLDSRGGDSAYGADDDKDAQDARGAANARVAIDARAAHDGRPDGAAAARSQPPLARRWCERLAASGATILAETTVLDVAPGPLLLAESGGRPLRIAAARLILATGARELFLPFPGWTLPNVVGVGGAQALLKSGARFAGRRVIVAGSGPLLLPVAASLARAGARLALVAEQAAGAAVARFAAGLWRHPRRLAQAVRYRAAFVRTPYRSGVWVAAARGPAGGAVDEVLLTDGRRVWRESCDVLACAWGLVPNLGLARLLGCELTATAGAGAPAAVRVDACQRTSVPGVYAAGETAGVGGLDLALASGQIAGLCAAAAAAAATGTTGGGGQQAGRRQQPPRQHERPKPESHLPLRPPDPGRQHEARSAGAAPSPAAASGTPPAWDGFAVNAEASPHPAIARRLRALERRRAAQRRLAAALARAFAPRAELRQLAAPETLVCRCEDVPLARLDPSWTARQAKLYARAGMGACQGRVCGAALAHQLGWTGLDSVRPPLQPATLATLAAVTAVSGHAASGGPAGAGTPAAPARSGGGAAIEPADSMESTSMEGD